MAQRWWSIEGRWLGETTYQAAIGGNQQIAKGSNYYFYSTGSGTGSQYSAGWWVGRKVDGTDPTSKTTMDRLPRAIQNNAETNGKPKPAHQTARATEGANAAGSMAGVNAGHPTSYDNNANYHRQMKQGITPYGEDVHWVRTQLGVASSGSGWSNPRGNFDGNLTFAVKNFQSRNRLTADGIVGPKTACALVMPGAPNCTGGTAAPKPSGGTTGGGSVSTPTPAAPVAPPPPPKPEPPYKLPKYIAPTLASSTNFNPISTSDLLWAQWGVFNAYELARVQHNQYFESSPPKYNVIPNVQSTLQAINERKFLIDPAQLASFATPDYLQDLEVLAFGTAQIDNETKRKIVYTAVRKNTDESTIQTRLLGVRFLRNTTSLNIGGGGPYVVSYISRRINKGPAYSSAPIVLTVDSSNPTFFTASWTTNPYADYYIVYTLSRNGIDLVPPEQSPQLPPSTSSWQTPAVGPNTTEEIQVRGYKSVTDINSGTSIVEVGASNIVTATTANVGLSAPATITYVQPVNGWVRAQFALPSPSTFFDHVIMTVKADSQPTSPTDGVQVGPFGRTNAGQMLDLYNVGLGNRPNDRVWYVSCWTYNSLGQLTPTGSHAGLFFMRNPVVVNRIDLRDWRLLPAGCTWPKWSTYNYMRSSGYAATCTSSSCCLGVVAKYTGLWFYGNGLQGMGGRNVTATRIWVMREDGGLQGAQSAYIGDHNYQSMANVPANNGEPIMNNVAKTPETFTRRTIDPNNSQKWVNMDRYNSLISAGQIEGFGMFHRVSDNTDDEHWNGQANGLDGRVEIYHSDFNA